MANINNKEKRAQSNGYYCYNQSSLYTNN